jgi:lysophospholipase L1-like esterase
MNGDGKMKKGAMIDGVHPSTEGYLLWADAMQGTLDELLAN